ncbi:MAG: polysaccharide biosynthesis/export family protein [Verrucomicrobiota bacterium]
MKLWNVLRMGLVALASTLLISGCGTPGKTPRPPSTGPKVKADPGEPEVDKLRAGDTIRVIFSNLERQIQPHEEQIKADGTITLPSVGVVKAEGKTTGELQNELQKSYEKYYRSMNVIVQAPERYYSVGGEVKNPMRYVYVGGTTVIKAIQSASDFTEFAKRKEVVLTRANGKRIVVNCEKALRDPRLDPPVYPGDSIHVPRRFF